MRNIYGLVLPSNLHKIPLDTNQITNKYYYFLFCLFLINMQVIILYGTTKSITNVPEHFPLISNN